MFSNFVPEPIAFIVFGIPIYWYGIFISFGLVAALSLALYVSRWSEITKDILLDSLFFIVLGGILGGRIYYVLYAWEFFRNSWIDILNLRTGGLAIYGVLLGGGVGLLFFGYRKKLDILSYLDIAAVALPVGQAIGRWGNFFNQELFGRPTSFFLKIFIEKEYRPHEFEEYMYFHPTFFYEFLLNIFLAMVLYIVYSKKNIRDALSKGSFFLVYLCGYASIRFLMEFYRIDYSPIIFSLRSAQFVSICLFIISLSIFILRNKNLIYRILKNS